MMIVLVDGLVEVFVFVLVGFMVVFNQKMQVVVKEVGVIDVKIYNMIGFVNGDFGEMWLKNVFKKVENQLLVKDVVKIVCYLVEKYLSVLEIIK